MNLTADYVSQDQPFDRGLIASEDGVFPRRARTYLGERWSVTGADKYVIGLAAQRQVTPWLMLRFTGRYTDALIGDRNAVDLQGVDDNRIVRRRVTTRTEDSQDLVLRFEGIADAFTGPFEHRIMAGAEHSRGDFSFRSARANIGSLDMFAPVYGATPVPVTRANAAYDHEARGWGFYLQDQIALGTRWKALVGLRYDRVESHRNDIFNAELTDTKDDAFTFRGGLVYQPTDHVSLYASYTESFSPQEGQLSDFSPLDPETGRQVEAGVKLDVVPDALSLTAAVFEIRKQNVATDDPADPDFSILTGEQRVRGAEIDLTGEIVTGWNIIANASLMEAEISRDNVYAVGNRLVGVPKWSGRLWTSYAFGGALDGLTVGGGVRLVGARQVDLDNSIQVSGYETFDAMIRYAVSPHLELSVNAENLADRFFLEGVQSESNLYPGTPRRVLGTIRARF